MKKQTIRSIRNISWLMPMVPSASSPVGLVENAALTIEAGRIVYVGPDSRCPLPTSDGIDLDASGLVAMPGLIDAHTHLVFGGDRIDDFYDRARGVSYTDIMARGGGIWHTVEETRAATTQSLIDSAMATLARMQRRGVTSVEVKSGYGLNAQDEIRILEIIETLGRLQPLTLYPCFLGAHAIPKEFNARREDYIAFLVSTLLPEIAKRKLAGSVDIFVEQGAFSIENARQLFQCAKALGLKCKIHADQLSASGGSRLAAEMGCVSASHLEYATSADFDALASAGVVAEITPLSEVFLGMQKVADLAKLRAAGVKIAIATDFNPGSAMCDDLQLALRLSVTERKLSVEEALLGVTHHAACALGAQNEIGQIRVGAKADLCLFEGCSPWALAADWTQNPMRYVIKSGALLPSSAQR